MAAPAWLWSADGARVLWSNAAGAAAFGAETRVALIADAAAVSHARIAEVARLAAALPANGSSQLARLRSFSNDYGHAALFSCAHIKGADGPHSILIVAAETPRRELPLADRARGLLAGESATAAFGPDGILLYADTQAASRLGAEIRLEALGFTDADEDLNGPVTLQSYPADDASVTVVWLAPLSDTIAAETHHRHGANANAPPEESIPLLGLKERRQPLRFVWQIDQDGRFTLMSEEFLALAGARTQALLSRPWQDVTKELDLDPEESLSAALASRETWNGIDVRWPIDGVEDRLDVTLSGAPISNRTAELTGYRGFGICHNVAQIAALAAAARARPIRDHNRPQQAATQERAADVFTTPGARAEVAGKAQPLAQAAIAEARPMFSLVPAAKNVLPFRSTHPIPADRRQTLTPVERNAFQEIARALGARFANEGSAEFADLPRRRAELEDPEIDAFALDAEADDADLIPEDFVQEISRALEEGAAAARLARSLKPTGIEENNDNALIEPEQNPGAATLTPAVAQSTEQPIPERVVLDRLPVAVLVYRANNLIYANRAFHDWSGYADLAALEQAGGYEQLFQAPTPLMAEEHGESGRTVSLRTADGGSCCVQAKLFSIQWAADPALLFVFTRAETGKRETNAVAAADTIGADLNELVAILDTATDGIVVMNESGRLLSGNRSAQVLFGYDAADLVGRSFLDLFAPESHREGLAYLDGLRRNGAAGILNEGRDMVGRVRQKDTGGGLIPLSVTMGRINDSPTKFCAVFRDVTVHKRAEAELHSAKRQAETVVTAQSDFLAKVGHEIRTPLTAIIGLSEAMMEQRFGPIGDDRYREHASDIRASAEQLIALINDLLALSKIETGRLDLKVESIDLNDIIRQCVAHIQPQANRERVIVRLALAPSVPPVLADTRALRQIVLNLLSNAIKRTSAGGQVIVSSAIGEAGNATLRVRDTGKGLNERDVLSAPQPLRRLSPAEPLAVAEAVLGLALAKALAEANGATFSVRSEPVSGALAEIAFSASQISAA